jgi:hypothetical protein
LAWKAGQQVSKLASQQVSESAKLEGILEGVDCELSADSHLSIPQQHCEPMRIIAPGGDEQRVDAVEELRVMLEVL